MGEGAFFITGGGDLARGLTVEGLAWKRERDSGLTFDRQTRCDCYASYAIPEEGAWPEVWEGLSLG